MKKEIKIILLLICISVMFSCSEEQVISVPVIWENLNGVIKDDHNNLKKTTPTKWGNAGASSKNTLLEFDNGWVEMEVDETNSARIFGLSEVDKDLDPISIQFSIYPYYDNKLLILEAGKKIGVFGNYSKGDKLKIERLNSKIQYFKNDSLLYNSKRSSNSKLVLDISLYDKNATITGVRTSFK